jgi:uncharacterized protein YjbJ (UPF0337 family)
VFAGVDIRIIRIPVRAPRTNAIAERLVAALRRGCLDHLLITGPRHLAAVLEEYVERYTTHRRHRSLNQRPSAGRTPPDAIIQPLRRDRLGGLLHEYVQVARRDKFRRILPGTDGPWWVRVPLGGTVVEVGFADKFTNRVQKLRGRMKRNAGGVSGDRRLEAEGRSEEVRGSLKQAGDKLKDAFRGRGRRRPRH